MFAYMLCLFIKVLVNIISDIFKYYWSWEKCNFSADRTFYFPRQRSMQMLLFLEEQITLVSTIIIQYADIAFIANCPSLH